jgi:hypothetical protein
MTWKPDRILRVIMIWTMVTTILVWLPFVRGLIDGDSYQWGTMFWGKYFGGYGIQGDYWLLFLQVVFLSILLRLGWRGAKQPFHWLLLLWHVPIGLQAFYSSFTSPEDYRFQGNSLGVDISLAWVGPVLFGGVALLSFFWVMRDLRRDRGKVEVEWANANRIIGLIAVLLLPIQIVLLTSGEPHGAGDQAGVIVTIVQWILINLALVPFAVPKTDLRITETADE